MTVFSTYLNNLDFRRVYRIIIQSSMGMISVSVIFFSLFEYDDLHVLRTI